jgi:hypothetical protein
LKPPMYLAPHGCLVALLIVYFPSAHGQQSDAAEPTTVPFKAVPPSVPALPAIIQLNEHPRVEPRDQMNILNATPKHAAPLTEEAGIPLPEMVANANGGMSIARAKESFSTLTLEGSELKAQEPVFGSREEKPTFIRELWQLRWRPNDGIDLYVILPRNVKKPPVVLYLYGFPTDTDRFKDDRYCERVTQNGAAAVGFVSALTGQRYAYRPFKEWFVSQLPESLASSVHDVQMILNQLKTREDLDLSRIAMFGQGSGATIAILAASVDPRIQALDLLDPWGDWPDWFAKSDHFPEDERETYLKPEFLKSLEPLEPLKYLHTLKDRRLRIQFVKQNLEPEESVKKLVSASPSNGEIHQYQTSHEMYEALSGGRLFSWLGQQLAEPAPPVPAEAARVKAAQTSIPAQK